MPVKPQSKLTHSPRYMTQQTGEYRYVLSGSARRDRRVLRVSSLQGYEVHAFAPLLLHLGDIRFAGRNSGMHKPRHTKSARKAFKNVCGPIESSTMSLSNSNFRRLRCSLYQSYDTSNLEKSSRIFGPGFPHISVDSCTEVRFSHMKLIENSTCLT